MIIAIAGPIGVGKTTVARALADRLGYRHISAGEVFRELARQRSVSVLELNRQAETDADLDRTVDRMQSDLAKAGACVVESRLAGWMVEAHLKIWLRAPLLIRAGRVAQREGTGVAEAEQELRSREESEWRRYRELYGIDVNDLGPYHLVIDTSQWQANDLVDALMLLVERLAVGGRSR